MVVVDSAAIPGIMDQPDYVKDYPKQFANRKAVVRRCNELLAPIGIRQEHCGCCRHPFTG